MFNTHLKSNLSEAILNEDYLKNSSILEIMNKSSNSFSIVFEGENEEDVLQLKKDFIKDFESKTFEITSFDVESLHNFYLKNPTNFLSDKAKSYIKNKNYEKLFNNAIFNLYSPTGFNIVPFQDDPYFLFSDFLAENLNNFNNVQKINDKYYTYLNLSVKKDYNFSSKQINKELEKLINSNKNLKLCGALIHSYFTTKYTSIFINLICILSVLFSVFLIFHCFKSLKPLIFISSSILFGFLVGFNAVKLLFPDFHLITLLFATTLIGLGIDYSIHYFYNKKPDKTFIKNLTFSYLTTAISFLFLYVSKIELLKQISIFMIFGLLGIYLFVLIIYPCFEFDFIKLKKIEPKLNKNIKISILIIFALICTIGLFNTKFDDSLSSLYIPNKTLKKNEIIYNKITNKDNLDVNFLINKAENIEELLQKEEETNKILKDKNINFVSLSKFIPSKKTQKENIKLVNGLYDSNLNSFSEYLSKDEIKKIKNRTKNQTPLEFDISNSDLKYFLLNGNKSMTIAYLNDTSKIEKKYDEVINVKKDVSKNLKQYRIILLKLLPVVYIVLLVLFGFIYGIKKGFRMYLPVVLSVIFAFFTSNIFGLNTNLFSVISLFLITGFTVDYSIFGMNGKNDTKSETKSAIFVSCLTTSFSFLLLSFVPFRLINSISTVLFLGIVASYFLGQLLLKDKSIQ